MARERRPRKTWRERAKGFGENIRTGVDKGVNEYNAVIDKIKEPSVDVGLDQKSMIYLAGALVLAWFLFKRK